MRDLRGMENVIPIKACFYNGGHTVLVMPIIEHDKFLEYFQQMDIAEVRDYMRNLLIALGRVHGHGIIHRDIKVRITARPDIGQMVLKTLCQNY